MNEVIKEILFEGGNDSEDILEQLFTSGYYSNGQLNVNKYLNSDKSINLEKLEIAIILLIDYLEKSVKFDEPIYINLGNMGSYVRMRGITDIDKIIEESSFILRFSQAVADENKIDRDIIVKFRGNNE